MPSVADLVEEHILRSLTDPESLEAGRELALRGAVAFDQFGPMAIRATVRDDEAYAVVLHVGPGSKLAWSCSEPGGSRGLFCRHCAAVAVEISKRALERKAEANSAELDIAAVVDAGSSVAERTPSRPPGPSVSKPEPLTPIEPSPRELPPTVPSPVVGPLLTGAHTVLFSTQPDELRAFFRDTLGLPSIDAGGGWLIFALPPSEVAVHPADAPGQGLYLLCDDLDATLTELTRRGFRSHTPVHEESWGRVTELALPGGGELPLYQPKHARPRT